MFAKIINHFKIKKLKKQARYHYVRVDEYTSGTCGFTMSNYIGYLNDHMKKFNEIMDELSKIDPKTPVFRFGIQPEEEKTWEL